MLVKYSCSQSKPILHFDGVGVWDGVGNMFVLGERGKGKVKDRLGNVRQCFMG